MIDGGVGCELSVDKPEVMTLTLAYSERDGKRKNSSHDGRKCVMALIVLVQHSLV